MAVHLARCPAGHRPGVRALLEWQVEPAVKRRPDRHAPQPPLSTVLDAGRRWQELLDALPGIGPQLPDAPLLLARTAIDWQPWPDAGETFDDCGEDLSMLGGARLWSALGPLGVDWFDLHLSLHRRRQWFAPPIQLVAEDLGPRGWCTGIGLRATAQAALQQAGISVQGLRDALADASACRWLARREGAGCFVSVGVTLE